jgi:hypothetical protein
MTGTKQQGRRKTVEMTELMENAENQKQVSRVSHSSLEISPKARDFHIPTASTTALSPPPNRNRKPRRAVEKWKSQKAGFPLSHRPERIRCEQPGPLAVPTTENQTCRSLTYRRQKMVLTLGATLVGNLGGFEVNVLPISMLVKMQ